MPPPRSDGIALASSARDLRQPIEARGGRGPEARRPWWAWIAGALAALVLAALAVLPLGRPAGPGTEKAVSDAVPARPGRAPASAAPVRPAVESSRAEAAAPPPGRETPPAPIERAEAFRPAPPGPAAAAERIHEVRRGDTLWDLSGRYYGDPHRWPAIWDVNRDLVQDPDLILPNERLRIPVGPATGSGEGPGR